MFLEVFQSSLYKFLSKQFDEQLPWGVQTIFVGTTCRCMFGRVLGDCKNILKISRQTEGSNPMKLNMKPQIWYVSPLCTLQFEQLPWLPGFVVEYVLIVTFYWSHQSKPFSRKPMIVQLHLNAVEVFILHIVLLVIFKTLVHQNS